MDEKPVHEVWLDGLWVGKHPVLVSQYLVFVKDTGQNQPAWLEEGCKYNIHSGNGAAHPVGMKSSNGLGIHDMCGNVSEWCLDFYHKEAYRNHKPYNPQNMEEGPCRAVRGGSWNYGARDVRCADRGLFTPEYRGFDLGFRLVRQV